MMNEKLNFTVVLIFCAFALLAQNEQTVTIKPKVFERAFNNPLKGFRSNLNDVGKHPFDAIVRQYIKWNVIERNAGDGIERILEVCNNDWSKLAINNSKVIPRVYLDWDDKLGNEYWPTDMQTGDYTSEQFNQRLEKLIEKLGKAWDNDSRVAWIQMGIIGYWGEQHSPSPSAEQQKLLGDLFTKHFKNKKVLVRYPAKYFTDYNFGFYWDRFADTKPNGQFQGIDFVRLFPDRWKMAPNEGEVGYGANYGEDHPGKDPDDSLLDSLHRKHLTDWIRKLHASGCGWISGYNQTNPAVVAGAEELQNVFGYRFLLKEVTYPKNIQSNQQFSVSFKVENVGAGPFYYDWPVELRLLDPVTRQVKWNQMFNSVDIRDWLPGNKWDEIKQQYDVQAPVIANNSTFKINASLPKGKYILALAILDPAGMLPSVKFATNQYFNGGNHPIGYIGIDTNIDQIVIDPTVFNDPTMDNSLYYKVVNTAQLPFKGINSKIPGYIEAEHYDLGGNGSAYYKNHTKTGGATYRSGDMVYISANNSASNGFVVGSTNQGEWLEYSTDVTTGNYDITAYYYCGETPGNLVLSLNKEILDTISGIQNKGWDKLDSITIKNVFMEGATDKILRLEFVDGAGFNIDALKFTKHYSVVNGLKLTNFPKDTLYVGKSFQLVATVTPAFAENKKVSWKSSDESVVTIDSTGVATAISDGTATITVTSSEGGFTDSCQIITKTKIVSVYGIVIGNCPTTILQAGKTHQLIANVAPADATNKSVTWSSSNTGVASIDKNGLVTALSQGSVKITVTTSDGGFTKTCNIGVIGTATGNENINHKTDIQIYPNPATDKLNFNFASHDILKIQLFDITGKEVYAKNEVNQIESIDLLMFKRGIYVVQVHTSFNIYTTKVGVK